MPSDPIERFDITFRSASAADAGPITALHADSWRRHYRGAYSDDFLDGDVVRDRLSVWSSRLAAPRGTATLLAEIDGSLAGFIHVVFDDHATWGSLIDNLHVAHDQRRNGIGRELLLRAAHEISQASAGRSMFLWVLEQNDAAQHFYLACGGTPAEIVPVAPPGGDPHRLHGTPTMLRMVWPDISEFAAAR